ncbi:MAG: hypothetical protein U1E56_09350 [Bauldia sp.]
MRVFAKALFSAVIGAVMGGTAWAADGPADLEYDLRDIAIGLKADAMPKNYYDFACGKNGAVPTTLIKGFTDFMRCPADASGLHEVYFTFDDELLRLQRANPDVDINWVWKFSGTIVAGFPVIASVLFDNDGVVRAIRMVTDPRAPLEKRRFAYMLRFPVERRYGMAGWECVAIPPAPGETKIGDDFIKNHCEKTIPERVVVIENRFYRKPGQTGFINGQYTPGEYESSARVEIWDPAFKLPFVLPAANAP